MQNHKRGAVPSKLIGLAALMGCLVRAAGAPAYEEPAVLAGTIYETSSGTNKVLFTFKRTATRSNAAVHVIADFLYPNGALAARETIVFQGGQLASFTLEEKQTGARGTSIAAPNRKNPAQQELLFSWIEGGKTKTDTETLQADTLVGDMIPYFIVSHWNELARGEAANFRYVASSRLETVGFKLVKESELTWRGKAAVRLRMEPSSMIIRQIVDPLLFIVEKGGTHRVLEYVGRTTPKQRDGSKWKDLDARTVYDW
jgi:hypothetical protein